MKPVHLLSPDEIRAFKRGFAVAFARALVLTGNENAGPKHWKKNWKEYCESAKVVDPDDT